MRILPLFFSLGLIAQTNDPALRQTMIARFPGSIQAMAADANGYIYAAGTTTSKDFPVILAAQAAFGGNTDVFVAKITPGGQTVWATFLGGSANESIAGLALDAAGNVHVAGSTTSSDFPATLPRIGVNGQLSGYLAKFDTNGVLLYSAVFGGETADTVTGLAVTPQGGAVIAGYTTSQSFPATAGAAYTRPSQKDDNGFAIKFDSGGKVAFASYLPGYSARSGPRPAAPILPPRSSVAIASEPGGSVLVAGSETARLSPDGSKLSDPFPSLPGSISKMTTDATGNLYVAGAYFGQDSGAASCFEGFYSQSIRLYYPPAEIFVAKLAPDTLKRQYLTHLGGVCESAANTLDVQPDGTVTVAGYTLQGGFPVADPVRQVPGGLTFQLDREGTLKISSYLASAGPAISGGDGSIYAALTSSIMRIPPPRVRSFTIGHARNAFNGYEGTVSPGMLLRIDGRNLAGETIDLGLYSSGLPATLGGIQVFFDGVPADMFRVAPDHIICVTPAAVASNTLTNVQVVKNGEASAVFEMAVTPRSLGLLTPSFPDLPLTGGKNADGEFNVYRQVGYIHNADGTVNSKDNPATAGSVVTLFATGLGNPVVAGTAVTLDLNPILQASTTPFPYRYYIQATASPMEGFISGLAALDVKVPNSNSFVLRAGPSVVTVYVN